MGLSEWLLFVKDNMEKSEHNAKKVRRAPLPTVGAAAVTQGTLLHRLPSEWKEGIDGIEVPCEPDV